MLQNAYLLAKIGADTAENEQHFAESCQKLATTSTVALAPSKLQAARVPAGGRPTRAALSPRSPVAESGGRFKAERSC